MSLNSHLLAIVDPSQDKQPALRRARINLERREQRPDLTVLLAVDGDLQKHQRQKVTLYRGPDWMEATFQPLKGAEVRYQMGISWASNWADAVVQEVERSGANLVLVPIYEDENGEHIITDQLWSLLRNIPVNLTLIHPRKDLTREERKVIMAAVKTQDPKFAERNEKTVNEAKALAKVYGAEVHLVNAYADQSQYPDRAKIIRETGIPNERIHIMAGYIEDVLLTVSEKIGADLLMIAPAQRKGLASALRGSTLNKIIRRIDCDIMAIV